MTHDDTRQTSNAHDDNVERLIGRSYRPDTPDPEFVARIEDRLLAAARARSGGTTSEATQRPTQLPGLRLLPRFAAAAAAALLVAGVVGLGKLVDGSVPAAAVTSQDVAQAIDNVPFGSVGPGGLAPRPLAPAPEPARVAEGDVLRTGSAERRRVTLPDASVLYVDADSEVVVDGPRLVRVEHGSVYVEVQRDPVRPFRVVTPTRELTALGTRFAVDVADGATSLLVTHGSVAAGADRIVHTGERLVERDGEDVIEAAGRTSHSIEWTRDLIAAAASPLVPSSDFEGGALIAMDPWGQETRLSLRKYRVDVHIEDGFARTTIDQTYFNHATWRLEGTFYFPLPADASLSRLAMYVAGVRMEGGMTERDRARDVYEQIVHRRKDPALLEWVDGSTFKMRVFPLEPREEKRILLSYVQRLPSLYGETTYRFPAARDLGIVGDWSFHARVEGINDWRSESHEMVAIGDKLGTLDLDASAKGVLMDDDVVLRLQDLNAPSAGATSFRSVEHEGFRYLMVRHRPELAARRAPERRDWVFLVETSGSRDPVVARAQVELVREMLALAEKDDRFALVTAATRATSLSDGLLAVTPENIAAAMDMLEGSHLIGALDLRRALSATRPFAADAEHAVVVHVGTGVSTMGERDPATLAKMVPEGAEYVGVAVGRQWSRPFMKQAAARSGGLYTQIDPTEPLAWRAFDLKATIDTPRVLDAKVVDEAEKTTFLGFEDTAAHGEEIVAVTRVAAGKPLPSRITLAGKLGGRAWSQTVSVENVSDDAGYLPRQWARLEIERLLAHDAAAHREKVVALSKAMYVMSPFTSLLVLETEAMYEQFGVDRGRSDHWALYPAEDTIPVVKEPYERSPLDTPDGATNTDELLGTILVRVPPRLLQSNNGQWNWRQSYAGGTYTVRDLQSYIRSYAPMYLGFIGDFDVDGEGDAFGDGELQVFDAVESLRETQSGRRWNAWGRGFAWRGGGESGRPMSGLLGGPLGGGGGGGRFRLGLDLDQVARRPSGASAASASQLMFARDGIGLSGLGYLPGAQTASFEISGRLGGEWGQSLGKSSLDRRNAFGYFRVVNGIGAGLTDAPFQNIFTVNRRGSLDQAAGRDFSGLFLGAYRGPAGEVPPDSRSPDDPPPPPDEALSMGLLFRIQQGTLYQTLQYQRPWVNNDARYFADLIAMAPGMRTTSIDIENVIATEGGRVLRRGTVDEGAARLINGARSAGWRRLQLGERDGIDVTFDGAGRFRLERTLPIGLREIIVCDGKRLRHLYPEIGVGAVREMSRHYRGMLQRIAPWLLGPVEDLAIEADVRLIDANTVEIVSLHDDSYRMRLTFADGLLVRRQLLKDEKELVDVEFEHTAESVDFSMRVDTDTEKSVAGGGFAAADASEPDLVADDSDLVVLPLPYRTRQHLWATTGVASNGIPMEEWSEKDSLAFLAADFATNHGQALETVYRRFVGRGDSRPGLYALLLAGGYRWDVNETRTHGVLPPVSQDPRKAHPESPLAHYVAACASRTDGNSDLRLPRASRVGFIGELAATASEIARWTSGRGGNSSVHDASRTKMLDITASVESPELRRALLTTFWNYCGLDAARAPRIAELLMPLTEIPEYSYHARYDRAAALALVGSDEALQQSLDEFVLLYDLALENGVLPAVDGSFLSTLRGRDEARWREHWLAAAQTLVERGARRALPYLGMQLHWVGDQPLGDEIIAMALDECPERDRLGATLATVEVLWTQGHYRRAEMLVEGLLEEERFARSATVWRLGAYIADAQGAVARGVLRQERALELAFDDLPDIIDLSVVRQEYGNLLARFQQLATAVQALGGDVPDTVISRVVRTADRWRALDDDGTAACQSAARILRTLGASDLAWDYLTTPLGARPNEGAPWHVLAQQLQAESDFDLADRCYATAFEIEPTNAQFLWDRAEMLRSVGRMADARAVWRTLANGEWQPRFQWIRDQAQQRLR